MKPQFSSEWKPIDYPTGPRSERLPRLSTRKFWILICRLIFAVNGLMKMEVGSGLKLTKTEGALLLEIDQNQATVLPKRWVKVCEEGVEYYMVVHGSQLYTVNPTTGEPGTIISGEPFSNATIP